MPVVHRIGPTTIAKVKTAVELKLALNDPWLESETIIVKPNWVQLLPATYTDAETLRKLFEVLDSKILVVEGSQIHRCPLGDEPGPEFVADGKERDWKWLMTGGWGWLTNNPDWSWFREGSHREYYIEMEKRFLDDYGFTDLFKEFNAEYMNVTNEIWDGRIVDPKVVKKAVKSRYPPVFHDEMYGFLPKKLYDLRGSTLISFSKLKQYATFTFKNMFGLIPDPIRAWWHGPKNKRMNPSIIGINQIYNTFFNIYGIVEAMKNTARLSKEGKVSIPGFKYDVVNDYGIIATGKSLVELDTIMCNGGGFGLKDATYLQEAEKIWGPIVSERVEEASNIVKTWLLS